MQYVPLQSLQSFAVGRRCWQRRFTVLAVVFFASHLANVLLGKLSLTLGRDEPWKLPDLPEMLLLVAAVVCFVVSTLLAEAGAQERSGAKQGPGADGCGGAR